jgi:hypothetical protein
MFLHFSNQPLLTARDAAQVRSDNGGAKPMGLWFTAGPFGAEHWGLIADEPKLRYATEVFLASDRILRLSTVEGILDLERKFGAGLSPQGRGQLRWAEIASKYDGIVVAPYFQDKRVRRKTCWYHEWECACGCVWKSRAVVRLTSLPSYRLSLLWT